MGTVLNALTTKVTIELPSLASQVEIIVPQRPTSTVRWERRTRLECAFDLLVLIGNIIDTAQAA